MFFGFLSEISIHVIIYEVEARTEENIKKLMNNLNFTAEKAMEVLDVPKEDYDKFKAML